MRPCAESFAEEVRENPRLPFAEPVLEIAEPVLEITDPLLDIFTLRISSLLRFAEVVSTMVIGVGR